MTPGEQPRHHYRLRHRLTKRDEFRAVYEANLKKPVGPLVLFALPNTLGHPRLGLSVGRRVGNAVQRNAIKRRLRDAFRLIAAAWPPSQPGLDLVLVVRPHPRRTPADYATLLEPAIARLAKHAANRPPPAQQDPAP